MSSDRNVVDESMDDGFPSNFLSTFSDKMDSELQLENAQIRTAQLAQERLKKFNEAWNVLPSTSSDVPSTSTSAIRTPPEASSTTAPAKKESKQPVVLPAQTTEPSATTSAQSLLGSPSSLQIIEDTPPPSTSNGRRLNPYSRAANGAVRRRSVSDEDERDDYEDENHQRRAGHGRRTRPSYIARSRSPPESRRSRRRRSRTRSRHRSRSPRRARSRSWSRESRSSRSSEREGRSRGSSRRSRYVDQPAIHEAVAPYMMAIMQMFNPCAPGGNRPMQPVVPGHMPNPFWQAQMAGQMPQAMMNQPVASTSSSSDPRLSSNVINSNQIPTLPNDVEKEQYDGTTELFLEGRMRFGQYLRENPSNSGLRNINPKVCERIKEAITILERQETKEQTGKFFFVPPSYYSAKRKLENRSPLICNDHNVLFGLTSNMREAKLCEPFSNVNGKLKSLIAKLGLDEGVISQQLEKCTNAKNTTNNLGDAGGSSRIEAISTLPPKPGSSRMRHMIERGVQTEGYACSDCVERTKKTFVATGSQTMFVVKCKTDAASQTPSQNQFVPKITLENLSTSQIETIEAIVQFIRSRHVTGPVDAVQHALSKDSTARTVMGPGVYQSAQSVMSMMTGNPRHAMPPYPPAPAPSSSSGGSYIVSLQQHVQTNRPTVNNHVQPQIPPPVPPTGGRYFQPYNNSSPFQPACYPEQPLSRKAKKRMNNKNR
ncbi:hypothetical protein ZHAS_00009119 [Anopheles sinensis]|uniref:Uncharacterized protein n=1 Tax=Anopheles sinensis TaxID=74873 RepID=A0A084VU72_ANOSI|nr:hypothetical protein ZHAS_00009119 [Anopheles sinensis]